MLFGILRLVKRAIVSLHSVRPAYPLKSLYSLVDLNQLNFSSKSWPFFLRINFIAIFLMALAREDVVSSSTHAFSSLSFLPSFQLCLFFSSLSFFFSAFFAALRSPFCFNLSSCAFSQFSFLILSASPAQGLIFFLLLLSSSRCAGQLPFCSCLRIPEHLIDSSVFFPTR